MRSNTLRSLTRVAVLSAVLATLGGTTRAELIYGLSTQGVNSNLLFSFDSANPGTASVIGNISNLNNVGETVIGIDVRPNSGTLFALTNLGGVGRLYTVNPTNAQATFIAQLSESLTGTAYGMDFNPTGPVALRIVGNNGQNLRVGSPATSGTTAVDNPLNSGIVGVAYSDNDPFPSTGTIIYYLQSTGTDTFLQTAANPNTGPASTIGAIGGTTPIAVTNDLGFDISGFSTTAYAAVNIVGSNSSTFHTINLSNGLQSLVGSFNNTQVGTVRGIATAQLAAPEPASMALLGVGISLLTTRLRRRKAG